MSTGGYAVHLRSVTPTRTHLDHWLEEKGVTRGDFADKLEMPRNSFERYCNGIRRPRSRTANAIERLTDGAVPASSWRPPNKANHLETPMSDEPTCGVPISDSELARWPGGLTEREAQVATLLASGYKTREIASKLGLSIKTIDTHRGHVLKKVDLRDEVALTRMAIREGLVSGAKDADAPESTRRLPGGR